MPQVTVPLVSANNLQTSLSVNFSAYTFLVAHCSMGNQVGFKGYLCYKTITSQNVLSEA